MPRLRQPLPLPLLPLLFATIFRLRTKPNGERQDYSIITHTKLISTKFTLVVFAAEVELEGSVEVGGRLLQLVEVVEVPQLRLQAEEEQVLVEEEEGEGCPQLEAGG